MKSVIGHPNLQDVKRTSTKGKHVDPANVTVLGQKRAGRVTVVIEVKKKKFSHKSPSKKNSKAGKTADFQSNLKNLDDKWSERFA